ncbi:nucleoside-diphosphate kinase [Clostridium peptidivorans]|uniref:nucleoside-diphosphate kinase n=1 Tax=Clostridium peptidivorans TaxID=100174 RepID=UPI000BE28E2F|nr:nucleoside-diphosphate kinase [Clostridium peptidivorans]
MERTLALIKPDGFQRGLIGEIISLYEKKGLKVTALKMAKPEINMVEEHYMEHKGRPYYKSLIKYITEDNIIAMILEGENAVEVVRKINGVTNPLEADLGSIRGRFGLSKERNLVHGSDSKENALREISIWFPELTSENYQ